MEKLNVLYTSDQKFIDIMLASIISLLENSNIPEIDINIITSGFSDEDYQKIEKVIKSYPNANVTFYPLEDFNIEKYQMPEWRGTQIANARLFFQEILSKKIQEIDNLLYLDSDTIIMNELNGLEEYNDGPIGAVKDQMKIADVRNLGLSNYYNSGVLYINTEEWINNAMQARLIEALEKTTRKLVLPDQDLINIALQAELVTMPQEYNLGPISYLYGSLGEKLYFNKNIRQVKLPEIVQAKEKPRIIHTYGFGNVKPWNNNTINPYNKEFRKYLSLANPKFVTTDPEIIGRFFMERPNLLKLALLIKTYLPSKIEHKVSDASKEMEKASKNKQYIKK